LLKGVIEIAACQVNNDNELRNLVLVATLTTGFLSSSFLEQVGKIFIGYSNSRNIERNEYRRQHPTMINIQTDLPN
jgi:hypothetical protein